MKTISLKLLTPAFFSLAIMAVLPVPANAIDVYVDPTMTATAIAATSALKNEHKSQTEKLTAIETMNLAISAELKKIHSIEDSVFKYLTNAQGFVDNLYDVKKCVELAAIDIPKSIADCVGAIPGHLQGTAISLLVSKNAIQAVEEITSLYGFLEILCKTGGYVEGYGSDKRVSKVNLLNSSQRYYVLQNIKSKLTSINWQFKLLRTQITIYGWRTLFQSWDPTTWSYYLSGKIVAQDIINRMSKFEFSI